MTGAHPPHLTSHPSSTLYTPLVSHLLSLLLHPFIHPSHGLKHESVGDELRGGGGEDFFTDNNTSQISGVEMKSSNTSMKSKKELVYLLGYG